MLTRDQSVCHKINLQKEEKKWTIIFIDLLRLWVPVEPELPRRGSFVIEDIPYCLVSLKKEDWNREQASFRCVNRSMVKLFSNLCMLDDCLKSQVNAELCV